MIYLHCKFYNVIKTNYGGPDTGHVRPAAGVGPRAVVWRPQVKNMWDPRPPRPATGIDLLSVPLLKLEP
jgi:hypothetical protein